jgi:hypothetical protein
MPYRAAAMNLAPTDPLSRTEVGVLVGPASRLHWAGVATSGVSGDRLLAHDELLTWAGYPVTARMPYISAVSVFRRWLEEAGKLRWPWQRERRALLEREAWRLFDAFVETGRHGALEVEYGVRPATRSLS